MSAVMAIAPVEKVLEQHAHGLLTDGEVISEVTAQVVVASRRRVDVVETTVEFATIGHLRGWCHFAPSCAICTPGIANA